MENMTPIKKKGFLRHLRNVLIAGTLVAIPLVGTYFVFEGIIARTPIIKYVYSAAREAVDSLRRLQSVPFKQVVIVEFPKAGMYSLGFITGKAIDFKGIEKIPVFIPHTPNPMTGFLVLLSTEDIINTDITVEDAMKMVLSGGLVSPEKIE